MIKEEYLQNPPAQKSVPQYEFEKSANVFIRVASSAFSPTDRIALQRDDLELYWSAIDLKENKLFVNGITCM